MLNTVNICHIFYKGVEKLIFTYARGIHKMYIQNPKHVIGYQSK